MKHSIVSNASFSESDLRLDAQYHLSDGPESKRLLSKSPYKVETLSGVTENIFSGSIFRRTFVNDAKKGFPYLTASDMVKFDIDSGKYISKKYTTQKDELELKEGWILVSCSGTLGNTVYTNSIFKGRIGTHDLIRIVPNALKIYPGFLAAYLKSKIGYSLLTHSSYGGVIKHIEPHHIEPLPVPIFPKPKQLKIHNLFMSVASKRTKCTTVLSNVHKTFTDALLRGDKLYISPFASRTVNDISTFQARLDASYHVKYKQIEANFKKGVKSIALGELIKSPMFTAQRGRRNYVKNGIKFLSTTDISELNPLLKNKFLSKHTLGLQTLLVQKDWILVSSSGQDILGSAYLVDETYAKCAVNQHSIRVIIDSKKISPLYVYGFISSPLAKEYIRSGIYGSAILTINEDFLEQIRVPMLGDDLIKKITKQVREYQQLKEEAAFEELEAIKMIEKEISSWQK